MNRPILFTSLILSFVFLVSALQPADASNLSTCVAKLKRSALKSGVSSAVANKALGNIQYDEKTMRFSRRQPEYRTHIWDYMAFLVDAKRIRDGRAMLKKHNRTLRAVEKAYGVDRYILTALWGIESDYGQFKGDFHPWPAICLHAKTCLGFFEGCTRDRANAAIGLACVKPAFV